ncbi:MAG: SpoIIE family protein phosphatase [Ignavibacteriaceae bacterium]|nr:SpoIIE family protein phosphatase [Ignavibacteriaceae bacterium]
MQFAKILVVDDEPDIQELIKQKFRNKIKANEYEFHFAENGAEALEKIISDGTIDLVLTDINMPIMDGLTLLSKINELNNKLLKSIIVSAYGDMENIRTAMNRGAYDFITKPIDLKDLEVTIEKSLKDIDEYKLIMSAQSKLTALQKELDIATTIQTSILPKTFPAFPERKEFDIYAKMIPAKEVGGDLYDFFLIDKYRLAVVIGDVSGKGIASALLMAVCKTLLKATAQKGMPTDVVLSEVNNMLVDESPSNMFVTLFYGILDTRSGVFEYSSAGHNAPYHISNDGTIKQIADVGGLILGAMKDAEYQSSVFMLKPEESLFFYTDGVTEAFDKNGEVYNELRLEEVLVNKNGYGANDFVDCVFQSVQQFTNGFEQSDDITCLALKYLKC